MKTLAEHLRGFYNALADEMARWLEAGMAEAAAAGAARTAALAADPGADFGPLREAIERMRSETPEMSEMRSAQWAEVPLQIRNRAQFSAGVESARIVQGIQERMERELEWRPGDGIGREAFIRGVREMVAAEGLEVNPQGEFTDISSNERLGLIYDMQTRDAHGYTKYKMDMGPDLLWAAPALELVRVRRAKVERDWRARWAAAGGELYGGRMIADKLSPVWRALSRFGNPWPPFDYNSGMGVVDVLRAEAKQLGVELPDTHTAMGWRRYNENVEAEIESLPEDKVALIKARLGEQVELFAGKLRLSPLSWRSVTEADEWAAEAYAGMSLAGDERAVLRGYQNRETGMHELIARWLREGGEAAPEVRGAVAALDRAMERAYAAVNGVVYRCIDIPAKPDRPISSELSFMSTSLCEQHAWERYGRKAEDPHIIKIYIPKGTKGIYQSQFTRPNKDDDEAEFLLRRNTFLKYQDQHYITIEGRKVCVVEMIANQNSGPRRLD